MRILLASCLIVVTLSIAYDAYIMPKNLKVNIIPEIAEMHKLELKKMRNDCEEQNQRDMEELKYRLLDTVMPSCLIGTKH